MLSYVVVLFSYNFEKFIIMTKNFLSIVKDIQEISNGKVSATEKCNFCWIAVIILGLSMFYVQNLVDPDNGAPTMTLVTLGLFGVIYGIVMLMKHNTHYVSDGRELRLYDFDFDLQAKDEVMRCFHEGDFHHLSGIGYSATAKMKLKVLADKDFSIVYAQPFCFEPYDYFPASDTRLLNETEARDMREFVRLRG